MRRVVFSTFEDNVFFLASALAFDTLLAAVPLVLLLLGVLGYVLHAGEASPADIRLLLQRYLPLHGGAGDPLGQAQRLIEQVLASRARLSVYGIPLFIWFATRMFGGIRTALNDVFDIREGRHWLAAKGMDFLLVLFTLLILVTEIMITVPPEGAPWWQRGSVQLGTFLLGLTFFFVVYRVAPSRPIRWDTAIVASLVCAVAFEIARILFAFYLSRFFRADRLLSDANAVAGLLFVGWVYYTACFFLIGGKVAETYDLMRRQRTQRALLT